MMDTTPHADWGLTDDIQKHLTLVMLLRVDCLRLHWYEPQARTAAMPQQQQADFIQMLQAQPEISNVRQPAVPQPDAANLKEPCANE